MKTIIFSAAFIFSSLAVLSNLHAQTESDELGIKEFTDRYMATYNQQDVASLQEMYLEDADRFDTDGREISGAAQIATYFRELFREKDITIQLKLSEIVWSSYQHAFVAKGTYEIYGNTYVYDIKIHEAGTYSHTMIKQNGEWKIARSILSPLPPQDSKVAANIRKYTEVWDGIVNKQQLDLFNEDNFTHDVIMHAKPENVVGLEALAAYYSDFILAFSDIQFTINNVFGQGNQLVKHWTFEGTHTGDFFGIPATGKRVSLDGSTITRMSADGRIAEERDFIDNMALLSQLGVVSSPGNVAVVDGLYKSFSKGDIPNALAAMDTGIVWNEAEGFPYADQNPYVGPDAVLNGVFARIGEEWEYWNLTDIKLHEMSGNMVLSTLRYKAKHKATGKEIDSQTAHLWTLKDGKIVAFQQFTDTMQAVEAINQ